MDSSKLRAFGAVSVVLQGIVTALVPQLSIKLFKRMIGKNFENADKLEAKPGYIRQLRALGVGMVAAGGVGFALERNAAETDEIDEAEDADEQD